MPSRQTFVTWKKTAPANFTFAVKASRYITHMKKLKDVREGIGKLLHNAYGLEDKLGPVLFQLPPGWKVNVERLEYFLKLLPRGNRYTIEFRNDTWYTGDVFSLLRQYNCAFCIYELDRHQSPLEVTADFFTARVENTRVITPSPFFKCGHSASVCGSKRAKTSTFISTMMRKATLHLTHCG